MYKVINWKKNKTYSYIARLHRKGNKMGVQIYQQKASGDWYVWITQKGQRTSRKIGKDKKVAMKAARVYREQLALGQVDFSNGRTPDKENLTFGDFCSDYLENVARRRLKRNSWISYSNLIKLHLLPAWKNKPLNLITRQDVKTLLLEKQATGIVINNLRICISAVFAEAVEREIIAVNPAHSLGKTFRKHEPKKHTQFLSKEQVTILLDAAKQENTDYYGFLLLAFRTGMRLGELLALGWDCVNFETRQIAVRRSYSHAHWDTPKSHKVRFIDMSDGLYEALNCRYEKAKQLQDFRKTALVFANANGEPINATVFRRRVFYKMLAKLNLPKIRIHDIRHTYASLLLQASAPIHYVKEQMGHSSITTTVDLYGHCQPGLNRAVLNLLD
jgi:integrase